MKFRLLKKGKEKESRRFENVPLEGKTWEQRTLTGTTSEAPTRIPEEEPSSSVPAVSDTHSLRHQFHDHARNLRRSPRLLISRQCGTYSRYIFTGTFSGFQSSARARLCTLSLDKSAGLVMEQRRNEPAAAASSAEHNGRSAHRRPAGSNEQCGRETRRVAAPERQRVAVDGRGWQRGDTDCWFSYKRRILSPHIEPKSLSGRGKLAMVQLGEPPVDRCQIAAPDYPADCSDNLHAHLHRRLPRPTLIWLPKGPVQLPSDPLRRCCPFQMTAEEKMSDVAAGQPTGKYRRIDG